MALKTLDESGSDGTDIVAEINITPLTDIFLVLLIIFMVTSSVMSQLGVSVQLPKASHSISQSQAQGVILTLLPQGKVLLQQQPVSLEGEVFERTLKAELSKTTQRLVILEGDRQALLGSAIEIMDRAKKAGAEKFAIATAPKE